MNNLFVIQYFKLTLAKLQHISLSILRSGARPSERLNFTLHWNFIRVSISSAINNIKIAFSLAPVSYFQSPPYPVFLLGLPGLTPGVPPPTLSSTSPLHPTSLSRTLIRFLRLLARSPQFFSISLGFYLIGPECSHADEDAERERAQRCGIPPVSIRLSLLTPSSSSSLFWLPSSALSFLLALFFYTPRFRRFFCNPPPRAFPFIFRFRRFASLAQSRAQDIGGGGPRRRLSLGRYRDLAAHMRRAGRKVQRDRHLIRFRDCASIIYCAPLYVYAG